MMKSRKPLPVFDWFTFFLTALLVMVAAWILTVADWTDHLGLVPFIALGGVIAGTALARSRFSGTVALLFAAVYGIFLIGWQLGTTMDPALIWRTRILSLLGRLGVFVGVLLRGEPNQDPLIFVVFMATLFWIVATLGAWGIFRKAKVWTAIILTSLIVLVMSYYYIGETNLALFIAGYAMIVLLLAVRVDMSRRELGWSNQHARVPADASYLVGRAGLVLTVLLVMFAWVAPAFARSDNLADAWRSITDPFSSVRERAADALGDLRSPVAILASEYDEELSLQGGTQPINRLVMEVQPDAFPNPGGRFYWRSRVYETYEEGMWSVGPGQTLDRTPNDGDLDLGLYDGRRMIGVSIAPKGASIQLLYLPPQPLGVDRSTELKVTTFEEVPVDVLQITSSRYIREGERYQVNASVAVPSSNQLREAGKEYPVWVTDRYLQVPEEITNRTRELALEITADLGTPYEKAVAVTQWLRENIEYDRESEPPPEDVEPLDWFLFDYQVGFCNYYASAEVIMLRTLGIPARLAAGYAHGEFDTESEAYIVRGEDSHSWPEVYFPGIGWVEFEPTTEQPVLERPEEPDPTTGGRDLDSSSGEDSNIPDESMRDELEAGPEIPDTALNSIFQGIRTAQWLLLGSIVVLTVLGWVRLNPTTWIAARRMISGGMSAVGMEPPAALRSPGQLWHTPIGRMYASWSLWLGRLGLATSPSQTPTERLEIFGNSVPDQSADARIIVDSYIAERFGGKSADISAARAAWRRMRGSLWVAWVWKLTDRWRV